MSSEQRTSTDRPAFKIEDGIPVPRKHGAITEVLCKLEVGQSVLFTHFKKPEQLGSIRQIVQRSMGIRLTTRTVPEGVRVWRVS